MIRLSIFCHHCHSYLQKYEVDGDQSFGSVVLILNWELVRQHIAVSSHYAVVIQADFGTKKVRLESLITALVALNPEERSEVLKVVNG